MCGIFGFAASKTGGKVNMDRVEGMAKQTVGRGPHAWGVAWLDDFGRLRHYKQPGRITDYLDRLLVIASQATMLIGHCRWATHGCPSDNGTNHPHPIEGGWLIHNGQIPEYQALIRDWGLMPTTECDSELIGQVASCISEGPLWSRVADAITVAKEYSADKLNHAAAVLCGKPSRLAIVRAGKPVYCGVAKQTGAFYFASGQRGLPRGATMMPNDAAWTLSYSSGLLRASVHGNVVAGPSMSFANEAY